MEEAMSTKNEIGRQIIEGYRTEHYSFECNEDDHEGCVDIYCDCPCHDDSGDILEDGDDDA
jgi:hypothetical protein